MIQTRKRLPKTGKWFAVMVLLAIFLIILEVPAVKEGRGQDRRPVSDIDQFRQELNNVGPLKFYDTTEEILRAAQFERAFMRYHYLKSRIAGQAAYRPLLDMVNYRLHFLQEQMQLPHQTVTAAKGTKRKKPKRLATKAKAANQQCPPVQAATPAPGEAKPGPEGIPKSPGTAPAAAPTPKAAGTPTATPLAAPPGGAPTPPPPPQDSQATAPAPTPEEPQEDQPKKVKPAPKAPVTRWDQLKDRVQNFWKKPEKPEKSE